MRRRQIEGPERERLVERARELRRAGATAREIAAALSLPPRGSVLAEATRREPRHPRTGRVRAKDDLRDRAVAMRLRGHTYPEIQRETGASNGSLTLWLSGITLPDSAAAALRARSRAARLAGAAGKRETKLARDDHYRQRAAEWLGALSTRELLLMGVVSYWCEGAKSKPWRTERQVTFLNSDPDLVRLFVASMRLLGRPPEAHTYRVCLHESGDVAAAERYWADVVGVPPESFRRATIKTHNPKTVRHNVGPAYRGCLSVRVHRSADVYRTISGVFAAVADVLGVQDAGPTLLDHFPPPALSEAGAVG